MTAASPNGSNGSRPPDAPLSFARWLTGTLTRWRLALLAGGAVAAMVLASAFIVAPVYRSTASFVSNASGGIKLPASIGSLAGGLSGMASQLGMGMGNDPSESAIFYVQLLHSRELLTRLAHTRFPDPRTAAPADSAPLLDMIKVRGGHGEPRRRLERVIRRLEDDISVSADIKTNLVTLDVDLQWPELSAQVANRTMDLVDAFNQQQRVTRAQAKRRFVEERLGEAQAEMQRAEDRHRAFREQNRVYRTSPTLVAEDEQLSRQVELATDLYTTLRREYETARINEVNDAPMITVVDTAVAPARPRWPRPVPLVVIALMAAGLVGLVTAGSATLYADWAHRNPTDAADVRRAALGALGRGRRPMPDVPSHDVSSHDAPPRP